MTSAGKRMNTNIVTWLNQMAMGGNVLGIALYKVDYTIQRVRESRILNVSLLATDQTKLICKLGQRSGHPDLGQAEDKLRNLAYALDERGFPYPDRSY